MSFEFGLDEALLPGFYRLGCAHMPAASRTARDTAAATWIFGSAVVWWLFLARRWERLGLDWTCPLRPKGHSGRYITLGSAVVWWLFLARRWERLGLDWTCPLRPKGHSGRYTDLWLRGGMVVVPRAAVGAAWVGLDVPAASQTSGHSGRYITLAPRLRRDDLGRGWLTLSAGLLAVCQLSTGGGIMP